MYDTVTVPILIPCARSEAVGRATFLTGERSATPVRPLRDEDPDPQNRPWSHKRLNEKARGITTAQMAKNLLNLWRAIGEANAADRQPELLRMIEGLREWGEEDPSLPRTEQILSQLLTGMLRRVQLVLWWKENRFVAALYCEAPPDALLVRVLLRIAAGQKSLGLQVCPRCSTLFLQKRPDQECCSDRCREARRVARWRRRKKATARARAKGTRIRANKSNRRSA